MLGTHASLQEEKLEVYGTTFSCKLSDTTVSLSPQLHGELLFVGELVKISILICK
jgi:hypothetical protein